MIGAYSRIIGGWRPELVQGRPRTLFVRATEAPTGSIWIGVLLNGLWADKVEEVPDHHLGLLDSRYAAVVAAMIRDWIAESRG